MDRGLSPPGAFDLTRFVMLITCPSCASEYVIDSALLRPNGRNVRCASCKTVFFAPPENPEPEPLLDPLDEFDAPDAFALDDTPSFEIPDEVEAAPAIAVEARNERPGKPAKKAAKPARSGKGASSLAAFASRITGLRPSGAAIASVAILLAFAAALLARENVVRALPQAAGLYALVGLEVNLRGVDIGAVTSVRVVERGETFLEVEGVLENVAGVPADVPPLALSIRDRTQTSLYSWTIDPPSARLAPGERVSFRARLVAPPVEARQVLVTFVPASRATLARTGP